MVAAFADPNHRRKAFSDEFPASNVARGPERQRIKKLPPADEPCDLAEYIGPQRGSRVASWTLPFSAESRSASSMTITLKAAARTKE
jgi:hypothetical protein